MIGADTFNSKPPTRAVDSRARVDLKLTIYIAFYY